MKTKQQIKVIRDIENNPNFDVGCSPDLAYNSECEGPIEFIYFTKDGILHHQTIGTTGEILKETKRSV